MISEQRYSAYYVNDLGVKIVQQEHIGNLSVLTGEMVSVTHIPHCPQIQTKLFYLIAGDLHVVQVEHSAIQTIF